VTANVVVTAQCAFGVADDKQRLSGKIEGEVVSRLCHLLAPADHLPRPPEDPALFFFEGNRIQVKTRRQRLGAPDLPVDEAGVVQLTFAVDAFRHSQ
jgi:hypothetical protein